MSILRISQDFFGELAGLIIQKKCGCNRVAQDYQLRQIERACGSFRNAPTSPQFITVFNTPSTCGEELFFEVWF